MEAFRGPQSYTKNNIVSFTQTSVLAFSTWPPSSPLSLGQSWPRLEVPQEGGTETLLILMIQIIMIMVMTVMIMLRVKQATCHGWGGGTSGPRHRDLGPMSRVVNLYLSWWWWYFRWWRSLQSSSSSLSLSPSCSSLSSYQACLNAMLRFSSLFAKSSTIAL